MGPFSSISVLLIQAFITLFAFFAVAPIILNAVSMFGVMRSFSEAMVREGVISQEQMRMMQPKKELAGVLISCLVTAALLLTMIRTYPYGLLTGGIGIGAGLLRYRRIVQYNSLTVQRFKNTYKDSMDKRKFDRFVRDHF